jgi:hypothetical protein
MGIDRVRAMFSVNIRVRASFRLALGIRVIFSVMSRARVSGGVKFRVITMLLLVLGLVLSLGL